MSRNGTVEYMNRDGSVGGRMTEAKYLAVRKALLKAIPRNQKGVEYKALASAVQAALPAEMLPAKGSASWLATTVKLDLEARGVIERIEGSKPQRVRRISS